MDLGSDTPDPEVYPDGVKIEKDIQYNLNTGQDEIVHVATCGWCSLWGDRAFRYMHKEKSHVVAAWQNHAQIFHPARLDPKFNARTVG